GIVSVATPISTVLADAPAGAAESPGAQHAGHALAAAAPAPADAGGGARDVAARTGSAALAGAVRNDLWLDPEAWQRLQDAVTPPTEPGADTRCRGFCGATSAPPRPGRS